MVNKLIDLKRNLLFTKRNFWFIKVDNMTVDDVKDHYGAESDADLARVLKKLVEQLVSGALKVFQHQLKQSFRSRVKAS